MDVAGGAIPSEYPSPDGGSSFLVPPPKGSVPIRIQLSSLLDHVRRRPLLDLTASSPAAARHSKTSTSLGPSIEVDGAPVLRMERGPREGRWNEVASDADADTVPSSGSSLSAEYSALDPSKEPVVAHHPVDPLPEKEDGAVVGVQLQLNKKGALPGGTTTTTTNAGILKNPLTEEQIALALEATRTKDGDGQLQFPPSEEFSDAEDSDVGLPAGFHPTRVGHALLSTAPLLGENGVVQAEENKSTICRPDPRAGSTASTSMGSADSATLAAMGLPVMQHHIFSSTSDTSSPLGASTSEEKVCRCFFPLPFILGFAPRVTNDSTYENQHFE